MTQSTDFNAIRISLASPDQIQGWSYGEVTKPETINYRTLRPEKDGLFCERIFGPTKDWECYCGKYKKIRYKGVICDRCGVEVTRSKVRRERMGHIKLAAPVAHIWFAKSTPSRLGLLLDLSPRNLERVLYFAQYVITSVNEEARQQKLDALKGEQEAETERSQKALEEAVAQARQKLESQTPPKGKDPAASAEEAEKEIEQVTERLEKAAQRIQEDIQARIDDLENLRPLQLLAESRYRDLRERAGDVFHASMGAEAVLEILQKLDLEQIRETLHADVRTTTGQRRNKAIKRLRVVEAFRKSETKPEWMVITVLPILPPDLRPMVQLDGGRFATSDLNDLYRRVINRNNRLKRLLTLGAPDIIVRNEKRMLQEAVDALIDNGRRGRAISGSHNHKLKSLSDLLRGKQGRFRQNLLGKRVDYSGRSVIVVGPTLQLHQCGLPKRMALELFKPFVMNRLVLQGHAHNIKSAKRMVERVRPEVWDILEDVIRDRPVLLNRAPTLHRLGIQAFQPVLIEGSAIQLHPLVCTAFNADFDGDQMAVHVPLSRQAVQEAWQLMLSSNNMLYPSSGDPIVTPTLDIVLGCYYLTLAFPGAPGEGKRYGSKGDARLAFDSGYLDLQAEILIRDAQQEDGWLKTTVGRLIFNEVLPPEIGFHNQVMDSNTLSKLVTECYKLLGNQGTAKALDAIKDLGFHYATRSGTTIAINDVEVPAKKKELMEWADKEIEDLEEQFQTGLFTEQERYDRAVAVWTQASDRMTQIITETLSSYGGIYMMATSGAKGNIAQIKQMAGMRGLMSDPRGRIIELPIKSSFREGLTVLEYFLSTHGARKGLTDTALRTADSGYLTRRLIDVSQDVIILEEDCGATTGFWVEGQPGNTLMPPLPGRLVGRVSVTSVADPNTGEILVEPNQEIDEEQAAAIAQAGIQRVQVRSPITCTAKKGLCRLCYGRSLATGKPALMGEAMGIIAAQSIGEPGTQLTMRTFHTGGVAGIDITSGLPRVEELFEARAPRGMAILAELDGKVEIDDSAEGRRVRVVSREEYQEEYPIPSGYGPAVEQGDWVDVGDNLARPEESESKAEEHALAPAQEVVARVAGRVEIQDSIITVRWQEEDQREYPIPASAHLAVDVGATVRAGDPITSGPLNPQDVLRILGKDAVQRYLIAEVQNVYRSQGITINDKHIEIIARQMLRKVRVDTTGDTELLPKELVDRFTFEEINAKILAEGGEPATGSPVLLGITRASLSTERSFLAAASFQETTRVLTEAAVNGAIDRLQGLKENVIIGRLIPARLDISSEGRQRLGLSLRISEAPPLVAFPMEGNGHDDRKQASLERDEDDLEDFNLTLR
ncbi:MAG: DNA-directed RNA polymerase subunit beta' [Dehalococcoidia bacterium]|nr:DNA-directed RNA polymerase subunit beta' [Dehalococcoidia bacterium]